MPDFTARFSAGVVLEDWLDPARPAETQGPDDPGAPSRLNPRPGYPHKRWVAQTGQEIEIAATVNTVEGLPDSSLSGRLFFAWTVERPDGAPVPVFTHPLGPDQSAIQHVTVYTPGHYCFGIGRQSGGGAILMHVDVEEP